MGDGDLLLARLFKRKRQQRIELLNELKIGRHHADYLPAFSTKLQRLTDNRRVASEAPLPESVAQDRHRRAPASMLFRREHSPQLWRDAERRKQVCCGPYVIQPLRFA